MAQSRKALGLHALPENAMPYFPEWVVELRSVSEVDSPVSGVPTAECINLAPNTTGNKGSRSGLNTIVLFVKLTGASATITLYAREKDGSGSDVHYKKEAVAISESTILTFENLPPMLYVPAVTALAVGATVEIAGGGTK